MKTLPYFTIKYRLGQWVLTLFLLTLLCGFVLRSSRFSRASSVGYIAYTTDRVADQFDLYRIKADGTGERRLTVHLFADEIDPDWSPDGSRLAFVSNRFGSSDIFLMDSDGSDLWRLVINGFRHEMDPAWSPNGREIAFAWDRRGGQFDIWVADLRTGIARLVTNDFTADERHPSWSPDGRYLAYTCPRQGHDEICVVNLSTLAVTQLTVSGGRDARQPAWSPDGTHILFTVYEDATEDSPQPSLRWRRLAPPPHRERLRGKQYRMRPAANWTLALPATATATVVATTTATVFPTPSATHTPTPIATATPIPLSFKKATIWIMNADGSQARPLIERPHRVFDPAWSPDGSQIAFAWQPLDTHSQELGPPRIFIYDIATGLILPLGPNQVAVYGQAPAWVGQITLPPTPTPSPVVQPPPPPATPVPSPTGAKPPPPPATPAPTVTFDVPPPPDPTRTPTATATRIPGPPAHTPTTTRTPTSTLQVTQTLVPSTITPSAGPTQPPPAEEPCQLIQNAGFESGPPGAPWMFDRHGGSGSLIQESARRTGQWGLRMGSGNNAWDEARQVVSLVCPDVQAIPGRTRVVAELSLWIRVMHEGAVTNGDVLNVVVLTADGRQLRRLVHTLTDADATGEWHQITVGLSEFVGETVQLAVGVTTDETAPTTFDLDDVRLVLREARASQQQFLPLVIRSRGYR